MAVSNSVFTGLDELFDYKNQLMNDLLTNNDVVRLLSEDGETTVNPSELMYEQVFPYEYVPDVTEHSKTFICCEVDIMSVVNKTYLSPTLYIWVFTHKSKVRLPGGGVRVDRLSSKITEIKTAVIAQIANLYHCCNSSRSPKGVRKITH